MWWEAHWTSLGVAALFILTCEAFFMLSRKAVLINSCPWLPLPPHQQDTVVPSSPSYLYSVCGCACGRHTHIPTTFYLILLTSAASVFILSLSSWLSSFIVAEFRRGNLQRPVAGHHSVPYTSTGTHRSLLSNNTWHTCLELWFGGGKGVTEQLGLLKFSTMCLPSHPHFMSSDLFNPHSLCCPYNHGCGTIHENKGHLPQHSLKENRLSLPTEATSCQELLH